MGAGRGRTAHYRAYACNRRNRVVRGLEPSHALGHETCYVLAETVPKCELNPASSGLVSEEPLFFIFNWRTRYCWVEKGKCCVSGFHGVCNEENLFLSV